MPGIFIAMESTGIESDIKSYMEFRLTRKFLTSDDLYGSRLKHKMFKAKNHTNGIDYNTDGVHRMYSINNYNSEWRTVMSINTWNNIVKNDFIESLARKTRTVSDVEIYYTVRFWAVTAVVESLQYSCYYIIICEIRSFLNTIEIHFIHSFINTTPLIVNPAYCHQILPVLNVILSGFYCVMINQQYWYSAVMRVGLDYQQNLILSTVHRFWK